MTSVIGVQFMRSIYEPVFYEYKVDLVLTGHMHGKLTLKLEADLLLLSSSTLPSSRGDMNGMRRNGIVTLLHFH